jgi:hypothetical protein
MTPGLPAPGVTSEDYVVGSTLMLSSQCNRDKMIGLQILVAFLLLVHSASSVGPNSGLHGLHFKISASHVRI